METINATHVAPRGYARTYAAPTPRGCAKHATYTIFCQGCGYDFPHVKVALDDDIIALILDREDGSVLEWVTDDAHGPDIAHLAHDGEVVLRNDALDNPAALALAHEATLYADCFAVALANRWPSA